MKKFINEFKEFAMKGNVVDMAVGVIIGAAFGKIVTSLVNDIIMPAIGVTAPLLILVTVRAIVPVEGRPPKKGTMQLAMPCPINS